jgi:hypothetical protein
MGGARVIVPLWAPFALLLAVCAVVPRPAWTRSVDWVVAGSYLLILAALAAFWWTVVELVIWVVS